MSTQSSTSSGKAKILAKGDNDVVIVYAIRSAMTKVSWSLVHDHFKCPHIFAEQEGRFQGHASRRALVRGPQGCLYKSEPGPLIDRGYSSRQCPSSRWWCQRCSHGRPPRRYPQYHCYQHREPSMLIRSDCCQHHRFLNHIRPNRYRYR